MCVNVGLATEEVDAMRWGELEAAGCVRFEGAICEARRWTTAEGLRKDVRANA